MRREMLENIVMNGKINGRPREIIMDGSRGGIAKYRQMN